MKARHGARLGLFEVKRGLMGQRRGESEFNYLEAKNWNARGSRCSMPGSKGVIRQNGKRTQGRNNWFDGEEREERSGG